MIDEAIEKLMLQRSKATVKAVAGWVDREMIDRYSHSDRKQKQTAVAAFDEMESLQ
jgi:hypothetical protein